MNFLTLLPVLLPIIKPVLKNIVGNSGAKQLVDLLDLPETQSALSGLASSVQFQNSNDRIIELLINKLPGTPMAESDRLESLEIKVENLAEQVVKLLKDK